MTALILEWQSAGEWLVVSGRTGNESIPVEVWPAICAPEQSSIVGHLWRLVEDEAALADGPELHVPHYEIAALSPSLRSALSLPAVPPVTLSVQHHDTLDRDGFRVDCKWHHLDGRVVAAPTRQEAFLTIGTKRYLLPRELYAIVKAIDRFNAIDPAQPDQRAAAWLDVQAYLPTADSRGPINASPYLRQVRVAHADAFSLRPFERDGEIDFDPVLFAAKLPAASGKPDEFEVTQDEDSDPEPLLPESLQRLFAEKRFREFKHARGRYALPDGWLLIMPEPLQKAMDVVRRAQLAPPELRRDFIKNPRGYLREALGDQLDEHLIESLFKETREFSDRVRAIGIWQKKVLPWVQIAKEPWLPPEAVGLIVGGSPLQLPPDKIDELANAIRAAMAIGQAEVLFGGVAIPATDQALGALEAIARAAGGEQSAPKDEELESPVSSGSGERSAGTAPHVLLVDNNFESVVFNSEPSPRSPKLPPDLHTRLVRSQPKPHQQHGLSWLQQCWHAGWTGALLADDMGLGKTFQALMFLAWLRQAMRDGHSDSGPILIVAPTGLLKNWEKEHEAHLKAPGLGQVVRAYGSGLRQLKTASGSELEMARPLLDVEALAGSDWILTTYETLRDYQHSFGRVRFRTIVFDEIQKIKTPGTQITDAGKAMQSEFVLALTGTPIENRLADLWCIMDTLHPGAMGDLKQFSQRYEAQADPDDLRRLKDALTLPGKNRPPVMLRRMKDEVLDALPAKREIVIERTMPDLQANAYGGVIAAARQRTDRGKMLEALQAMRSVSLAPVERNMVANDEAYIASSARMQGLVAILDEVAARDEKALIFVESRAVQSDLVGVLQRRYRLQRAPMIISGAVAGPRRQERVDAFQAGDKGFDLIILSPKAAGVGLTLTAANNVVHLSRWWNPAVEDQSTDRCYRIGQTKDVNVYLPLALLPGGEEHSFDRRLHALLQRKRSLSREMLMPPAMTDEDARKLFEETLAP